MSKTSYEKFEEKVLMTTDDLNGELRKFIQSIKSNDCNYIKTILSDKCKYEAYKTFIIDSVFDTPTNRKYEHFIDANKCEFLNQVMQNTRRSILEQMCINKSGIHDAILSVFVFFALAEYVKHSMMFEICKPICSDKPNYTAPAVSVNENINKDNDFNNKPSISLGITKVELNADDFIFDDTCFKGMGFYGHLREVKNLNSAYDLFINSMINSIDGTLMRIVTSHALYNQTNNCKSFYLNQKDEFSEQPSNKSLDAAIDFTINEYIVKTYALCDPTHMIVPFEIFNHMDFLDQSSVVNHKFYKTGILNYKTPIKVITCSNACKNYIITLTNNTDDEFKNSIYYNNYVPVYPIVAQDDMIFAHRMALKVRHNGTSVARIL